jgi:hypothetical protein
MLMDMIHHHDYQLLTVQKEVLHIPLWGGLVLVQEKFQQLILQGLQRYHLRQSIKLIFVVLSKNFIGRRRA